MVFVKFYAPWCGHCRRLKPTFEKLADMVYHNPELKPNVMLATVDCDLEKGISEPEKALCVRYNVGSFPTLMLFPKSKAGNHPIQYNGGRSEGQMMSYLQAVVRPPKNIRIYGFDLLAREFYHADVAARPEVLERTRKSAESFSKGSANKAVEIYLKLMERAVAKEQAEYFEEELARVSRILQTDLTIEKMDAMLERKAIVEGFLNDPVLP